jgi:chaperonin GroEL (HSP60 family)
VLSPFAHTHPPPPHPSQVINNLAAGVVEPAMSKVKSLKFATEAAITILRIDDFIKISPPQQQQQGGGRR